MGDLVEALKKDPGAVSWGGGSAGGTDHIAVGLIAKAAGVDPTKINYIAFSGGGEALAAILGSQVTAGISGYGEFESQVKAGTLRLLAVSSAERLAGIDAPTLKEAGLDVVVQNWRMVAAAPGLSAEQKAAVTADIEKLVKSAGWQETLKTKGWQDTYLVRRRLQGAARQGRLGHRSHPQGHRSGSMSEGHTPSTRTRRPDWAALVIAVFLVAARRSDLLGRLAAGERSRSYSGIGPATIPYVDRHRPVRSWRSGPSSRPARRFSGARTAGSRRRSSGSSAVLPCRCCF